MTVDSRTWHPLVRGQTDAGIATITASGELDFMSVPILRQVLDGVLAREPDRLILDLSRVTFIDCACARVLVAADRGLSRRGSVVIRRVSPVVRKVLELTGLSAPCQMCGGL